MFQVLMILICTKNAYMNTQINIRYTFNIEKNKENINY